MKVTPASVAFLARRHFLRPTSVAIPLSHFMWITFPRCHLCGDLSTFNIITAAAPQGEMAELLSVWSMLTAAPAGFIRCFIDSPIYRFCTEILHFRFVVYMFYFNLSPTEAPFCVLLECVCFFVLSTHSAAALNCTNSGQYRELFW